MKGCISFSSMTSKCTYTEKIINIKSDEVYKSLYAKCYTERNMTRTWVARNRKKERKRNIKHLPETKARKKESYSVIQKPITDRAKSLIRISPT